MTVGAKCLLFDSAFLQFNERVVHRFRRSKLGSSNRKYITLYWDPQ